MPLPEALASSPQESEVLAVRVFCAVSTLTRAKEVPKLPDPDQCAGEPGPPEGRFVYSRANYEEWYHRGQYRLEERDPEEVLREWEAKGYRRRSEAVWRAMPCPIRGAVLEVACHHGKTAVWMLEEFPGIDRMYMFDFSSVAVRHCRRIARHCGKLAIWQGDVSRIPLRDGTMDFINCTDVTEHLPESIYREMLVELYRVLRPGGRLLLMQGHTRLPEHIHILTEEQLVADLEEAGFRKLCDLPHRHHLFGKD